MAPQLDRHSPIPLYFQLYTVLSRMIADRVYEPDAVLPTEGELGEMFGVSRITVRQAVSDLLQQGMVYRGRSRGRLQVSPPRIHQRLNRLRGFFTEDMLRAHLDPHTVVRAVAQIQDGRAARALELDEGELMYRVDRLHEGGQEPLALQTSFIPVRIAPRLEEHDLSDSLFRLVEQAYGRPIVRAIQHMHVREATQQETLLLHIRAGASIIQVERTSYALDRCPVEYFVCILRSDRYDFTMELHLDGQEPGA